MNAVWRVLMQIGLALVSALPLERVAAALIDRLVQKVDGTNIERARKSAAHLAELAELFADVLADKQVTEIEVAAMKSTVMRARELLLENWADGRSAKTLQTDLAKTGLTAATRSPRGRRAHARA
jgi:hypothetical protein